MDNVVFIAELFKNGLLPNDLKAKLKSLPTSAEKAADFLDDVIEPSVQGDSDGGDDNQFVSLLSIMKESEYDNLKKLADTILSEIDQVSLSSSTALGELYFCTCS